MFTIDGKKYVGAIEAAKIRTEYEAEQAGMTLEGYVKENGHLEGQTITSWTKNGLPFIQDDFKTRQPRYVMVDDLLAYERRPEGRPRKMAKKE